MMLSVEEMLRTGDRAEWRRYLAASTIQQAMFAYIKANAAGMQDMASLAWKRQEHLNGEHRHPDLWP